MRYSRKGLFCKYQSQPYIFIFLFLNKFLNMSSFDVIVVGAGIVGSAAAQYLRLQGKNVLLLEQVSSLFQ